MIDRWVDRYMTDRSFNHRFTLQVATTARVGSVWNQEWEAFSRSPTWIQEPIHLSHFQIAFPGTSAGTWTGSGRANMLMGRYFTLCATALDPCHCFHKGFGSFVSLLCSVRTQWGRSICEPVNKPYPHTDSTDTLILDCTVSRAVISKFTMFIN